MKREASPPADQVAQEVERRQDGDDLDHEHHRVAHQVRGSSFAERDARPPGTAIRRSSSTMLGELGIAAAAELGRCRLRQQVAELAAAWL